MQEHYDLTKEDSAQETLPNLQPLSLTDILDGMFMLYRNNFRLFLPIVIVYFVATFLIDKASMPIVMRSTEEINLTGLLLTIAISMLLTLFIVGALSYATAQVFLGNNTTAEAAMQQALRRLMPYLGASIIYYLVATGLSITCIGFPFAVYLIVRWGLYYLPILLEESPIGISFRRSSDLVKGNWLRVFGIMLAIVLVYYMITSILSTSFTFIFLFIPGTGEIPADGDVIDTIRFIFLPTPSDIGWFVYIIRSLFTTGIAALAMPIASIGYTLLYFDMRIRKEAYDLEVQATN